MRSLHHRRHFSRISFFREWMAGRALRRRTPDFTVERPMVSIIGDEVSDVIRAEQVYERDVLEFLRERVLNLDHASMTIAVDVGANIGNHTLFLSDLFGRVVAFEPNPLALSLLRMNIDLNGVQNVEVNPFGLSDHKAQAVLEFELNNLGAASAADLRAKSALTRRSTIDLAVGDQVIDRSEPVGFIKIDVEGAEQLVLKGLEQTIRKCNPVVIIEQWPEVIDELTGTSPSFSFLRELGYSAWEVQRIGLFQGRLGKIPSLLVGHTDFALKGVDRLEQREYRALIFTPQNYTFPGGS